MATDWKTCRIKDVAASMGDAPFGSFLKNTDYTDAGALVVQGKNIQGRTCDWTDRRYVSHEKYETLSRSHCFLGDLIFPKVGTIGKVGRLTSCPGVNEYVLSTNTMRFRADESVALTDYVYYFFTWPKTVHLIHALNSKSVQPVFNFTTLKNFEIILPPLAEQKAIAAVLGALDDKIELNRRMSATLETMARALFQSWFVDFDPVRTKLDGREPAGIDPATAALFPNEFEDSELGPIPKGWKVSVLNELTNFVIGGDWGSTEPTNDETVSCYCIRGADIPSLQEGGVGKMPIRFLKPSSVEKRRLLHGDLAIEISGGSPTQCTGRPVLASDGLLASLGRPLVASNFCRIVKLKSLAFSKLIYCWLRGLYDAGSLFQFETGTTGIKNFAFVLFSEKYPLVVPDQRIAEAFDRIVSPLFARIQANACQSRTLATLRDSLLPKLLSGDLSFRANGNNQTL